MALKGFVDNARQTNKLMEEKLKEKQAQGSNTGGIIDISDGQSIPKEKLEEIQSTPTITSEQRQSFNYGKKVGSSENNYQSQKNDYEVSRPSISSSSNQTDFEKEYLKRKQNFAPRQNTAVGSGTGFGRTTQNNSNQKIDSRHGNVIANVIRESGNKGGTKVHWEECKHLKKDGETLYCREYHCFCKKDACPFSCK